MKIITIEEHFISGRVNEKMFALEEKTATGNTLPIGPNRAKLDLSFRAEIEDFGAGRNKYLDENGIAMQVVSYDSTSPQNLPSEHAILLCKEANDELAAAVRLNTTRSQDLQHSLFGRLPVYESSRYP